MARDAFEEKNAPNLRFTVVYDDKYSSFMVQQCSVL
jgi:hypothetical protein